jgi:Protein of unknown function (DUF3443)
VLRVIFAVAAAPARAWRSGLYAVLCLSTFSCGGGGGSSYAPPPPPSGSNVVSVVVDSGPAASTDVNTLFTTVTVCVPGSTTNCQTIDHIQVDTASDGLRILAPVLILNLPVQMAADGNSLVECTQFVDGYSWGPVALADVQISGESASSVPVQVIGDPGFTVIPADCSSSGTAENTVAAFGANGILGIGVFNQDCGSFCASTLQNGSYYSCTTTLCTTTTAMLTTQVTNPVVLFAADNNGVVIQMPSVAAAGAASVTGSLTFGIDTQTNNKSGSQTILTVDPDVGYFTTVFNAQNLTQSFLDTGSNGIYFNDASIPQCTDPNFTDFYCPAGTQNLSAMLQGQNAMTATVSFSIANAQTLASGDPSLTAFATLSGPYPGTTSTFDWGLPFYFNRTVYTAFENAATSVGTGPYVAF